MTHSSLLADLIDLSHALEADHAIDLDTRRQRDRVFGRKLQHSRSQPAAQIRAWLRAQQGSQARSNGRLGSRLYHTLCLVLLCAGLVTGWGLASAVLAYDGNQPINIVNAVVVLVLPQILLLLVWLLTTLPGRVPLFADIRATLEFLNPGRLTGRLAGMFNNRDEPALAMLWNPDNAVILAPAARWLYSFWSQLFATGFNVGVLASAFFLVSFSDLAFAWSTTLSIGNESFHQLLAMLSAPWAGFLPEAVPGAELVANSRYYRLEEGSLAGSNATPELAIELGRWWPFLIAAVGCYGLLPRLVTLGISWYRFRFHLRRALCNLPGAPELLARMNSPLVSTLAAEPEQAFSIEAGDAIGNTTPGHYALRCPVIEWAGAVNDTDAIRPRLAAMGIEAVEILRAGGRQSTEQDRQLVTSLCRGKPAGVGILVRGWEPPVHDLLDFVVAVRQQCSAETPLILLLWGGRDGVNAAELETWQLTLGPLADPQLHLEIVGKRT